MIPAPAPDSKALGPLLFRISSFEFRISPYIAPSANPAAPSSPPNAPYPGRTPPRRPATAASPRPGPGKILLRGRQEILPQGRHLRPIRAGCGGVFRRNSRQGTARLRDDAGHRHQSAAPLSRSRRRGFLDLAGNSVSGCLSRSRGRSTWSFSTTRNPPAGGRNHSRGVAKNKGHEAIFGYFVGNEIPTTMVRWLGARRVLEFVEKLIRVAARPIRGLYIVTPAIRRQNISCLRTWISARSTSISAPAGF